MIYKSKLINYTILFFLNIPIQHKVSDYEKTDHVIKIPC